MNDLSRFLTLSPKLSGRNLYLVGMMGSGKSQTGPHLAKALGYRFLDIDEEIEKATKKSISSIFEEDGESTFRALESEVLKEIGQRHSFVVSTGGGLVTSSNNWGFLHQGIVIWLDPGRTRLLARLQSDEGVRPLLKTNNLQKDFDKLWKERESIYRQSDFHIKVENESPLEVSFLILHQLNSLINQKQIDPDV